MPHKANEVVIVRSRTQAASDPAFQRVRPRAAEPIAALGPGVVDWRRQSLQGG